MLCEVILIEIEPELVKFCLYLTIALQGDTVLQMSERLRRNTLHTSYGSTHQLIHSSAIKPSLSACVRFKCCLENS